MTGMRFFKIGIHLMASMPFCLGVSTPLPDVFLLKEDGGYLLKEGGGRIRL